MPRRISQNTTHCPTKKHLPGGGYAEFAELAALFLEEYTMEKFLPSALEIIGRAIGKGRVSFVPLRDNEGIFDLCRCSWQADEDVPATGAGSHENTSAPERFEERYLGENPGAVLLKAESFLQAERELLKRLSVGSMLLVPVETPSYRWGILRIDDDGSDVRWADEDIRFAEDAAALFALAIESAVFRSQTWENGIEQRYRGQKPSPASPGMEEITRWKEALFSSFAHAFRTPLYALLGFSATLLENETLDEDPEIRRMCLRHIYEQAHRLENVVEDILYQSGLRRGADEQLWENADLAGLLAETAEPFRERGADMGIIVHIDTRTPSFPALCEPMHIRRMLSELLEFSLRSSERGGWVSVTISADGSALTLVVSDNGRGLTEE
ncbi:MAG: histidine kinase dimerization/phospho-acceptor domain-containing protein, partial [Bacteroidota bacterium]|nr:histidine kinase dimerization/phospho-acceptor domain-containing protein [Bacteroidota bacterium]